MQLPELQTDPTRLRDYLLGRLDPETAALIDRQLETDPDLAERMEAELTSWRAEHPTPQLPALPGDLTEKLKRLVSPEETGTVDVPSRTDADTATHETSAGALPAAIGRYRIDGRIGAGGMGTVYRAFDPELDRPVAIKVPTFFGPADRVELARQRFLREARSAAKVRHPNVCPIYDVGETDGHPFVVMALIENGTLSDRIRRDGPAKDISAAVGLVRAAAAGLQAVHDAGLLHRDMKPGNILLDNDNAPLLTDFGLARTAEESDRLTADGSVVGTPAYMSPEQADPVFGPVTERSDQYGLAVVLYQALSGRLPYEGSVTQVLGKLGREEPTPVREHRSDLPREVVAVIDRAMSRRAEDRFASVSEFAAALGGETVPDRPKPTPRRWPIWAAAAAVLIIGVGLGVTRPWESPAAAPSVEPSVEPSPAGPRGPVAELPDLKADIDMRVENLEDRFRDGRTISQGGVLPLRPGDQARVLVTLNRPAYVYLIQIDTAGEALPLYPWKPGRWERPDEPAGMIERLTLPEEGLPAWGVSATDPTGMETLLLLAREERLPPEKDAELRDLFAGLPVPTEQNLRSAAWFENGKITPLYNLRPATRGFTRGTRGFDSFDPEQADDPVMRTQRLLQEKLGGMFDYTRAVSYAHSQER